MKKNIFLIGACFIGILFYSCTKDNSTPGGNRSAHDLNTVPAGCPIPTYLPGNWIEDYGTIQQINAKGVVLTSSVEKTDSYIFITADSASMANDGVLLNGAWKINSGCQFTINGGRLATDVYKIEKSTADSLILSKKTGRLTYKLYYGKNTLKTGLLAYWGLNNSSFLDSTANHYDWTVATGYTAGATANRLGTPLTAYIFTYSGHYGSMPDYVPLRLNNTDYTINVWVSPTLVADYEGDILDKKVAGNNGGWMLGLTGHRNSVIPNKIYFQLGGTAASMLSYNTLLIGKWYMLTFIYKQSTGHLSLYVNGVLDHSTAFTTPSATENAKLGLGDLNAKLDEIRIYNRALNTGEMLLLYKLPY